MSPKSKTNGSFQDIIDLSGSCGYLWLKWEDFLFEAYNIKSEKINYLERKGWGVSYKHGKKIICDIHPEENSFVVYFYIKNKIIEPLLSSLSQYSLEIWKNRSQESKECCLFYRVTKEWHLEDVKTILVAKIKPKKSYQELHSGDNIL
jgi:hypothetical protein